MPVYSIGEKAPSVYLERFDPPTGLPTGTRLSVLDTRAIGVDTHFVDIPSRNVKGFYQCIQGACCHAFGRRGQSYGVPVYVYPQEGSTAGEVQMWNMSPSLWGRLSMMFPGDSLLKTDIIVYRSKQGGGTKFEFTAPTGDRAAHPNYRAYMSQEQLDLLAQTVSSFFAMGDEAMCRPMVMDSWNQLLYDVGYDLNAMAWPGGVNPMDQRGAFGAVKGAVAPALPAAPMGGGLPALPSAPTAGAPQQFVAPNGQVAGGIAHAPPTNAVPQGAVPPAQPSVSGAAPSSPAPGLAVTTPAQPTGSLTPQAAPLPPASANMPVPANGAPVQTPLGTAPNVGAPVGRPPGFAPSPGTGTEAAAAPAPIAGNTVAEALVGTVMTAQELNDLLT